MLNRLASLGSPCGVEGSTGRESRPNSSKLALMQANCCAFAGWICAPFAKSRRGNMIFCNDANRADRRYDFVQPRCDGDVGVHDDADLEQFFDQRLFVRRWDAADDLFLHQRIFLQRIFVEQL